MEDIKKLLAEQNKLLAAQNEILKAGAMAIVKEMSIASYCNFARHEDAERWKHINAGCEGYASTSLNDCLNDVVHLPFQPKFPSE